MSKDEIAVMDGGKCILQVRGVRPFLSDKYDITKHPRYKELSDYNEKYAFDIEKFVSRRLTLRADEEVEVHDIEISEAEMAEAAAAEMAETKETA